ncbi:hypothetical protein BpHYR1_041204, partial [Brachionus plicatilis]
SDKKSKQSEHIDKFEKKIHSAFNEINKSQLKDLFRMMVKIKECLNQFYYEINNFSSEIDLTKSEKKMINALKKCWLFFSLQIKPVKYQK